MNTVDTLRHGRSAIRNFCIIAHIDHGKSTLADRIIEMTHTVSAREMKEQLLDSMDLERERGITIKLQPVRMYYQAQDGNEYELNLIDTPGHADFTYEVSRSLGACEGALLVIDATQGVQAQTLANLRLAQEQGLFIIPVINKVDMANADPDRIKEELRCIEGIDTDLAIFCSAKTGQGIIAILERVVSHIPPPSGKREAALQALVFDSHYDFYRGVVLNVRVVNGRLKKGQNVRLIASGLSFDVQGLGVFTPSMTGMEALSAGQVGYVATGMKNPSAFKMGDTMTGNSDADTSPLPGYREARQTVFAGMFPVDSQDQEKFRDALEKLALNDAAFTYEPEVSSALGAGARCGFLGILHLEIVRERLEREYDLEILSTAPSVQYKVHTRKGNVLYVINPKAFPNEQDIDAVFEPYVAATIILPAEKIGVVMELCAAKRGEYREMSYLSPTTVELLFSLPLSEISYDFYDALKSITQGYASVDYGESTYKESDLVKMDIWLNDEPVDAFSYIVHRANAYEKGKKIVQQMKYLIPRKLYPMPVQSVVENRVIAREDIPPLRKSATGKGFPGSTSKKKRIAKQITGNKSRQRKLGKAEIPQEAFDAILRINAS